MLYWLVYKQITCKCIVGMCVVITSSTKATERKENGQKQP